MISDVCWGEERGGLTNRARGEAVIVANGKGSRFTTKRAYRQGESGSRDRDPGRWAKEKGLLGWFMDH